MSEAVTIECHAGGYRVNGVSATSLDQPLSVVSTGDTAVVSPVRLPTGWLDRPATARWPSGAV